MKEGRKCLFNNALNTFYLWLYDIGYMVKDHSDSQRVNLLLPLHGIFFLISSKGCFNICIISQTEYYIYHGLCYTSPGALVGTRVIAQWVHHEGSI